MSSSSSSSLSQPLYSDNIVVNGNFDGNADGWTLSGGIKYESYNIVAESSYIPLKRASQLLPTVLDANYLVEFTLSKTGKSTSSFSLGGSSFSHDENTGILSAVVQALNSDQLSINLIVQTGKAYISNVSVRRVWDQSSSSPSSASSSSDPSSSSSTAIKTTSSSDSSFSSSQSVSLSSSSSSLSLSSSSSSSSSSTSVTNSDSSLSSISSDSTSSSSSISSLSSSLSSNSSVSSSSLSSDSSFSSKSSSSTQALTSSSSLSSLTSSSSSNSLNKGCCPISFRFEGENKNPIWCFAKYKEYIYAGTGPEGKVITSNNFTTWKDFVQVDDNHVKSLFVWDNALFIGTEPMGQIYINNFVTGKFYQAVQTEDSCVSAFAEYMGELYVGTKPRGIIYKFNGNRWTRFFDTYSNGVNAMVSSDKLVCILDNAETGVVYDGKNWKAMTIKKISVDVGSSSSSSSTAISGFSDESSQSESQEVAPLDVLKGGQSETFSSFRKVTTEPFSVSDNYLIDRKLIGDIEEAVLNGQISEQDKNALIPQNNANSLLSAHVFKGNFYFGSDNGTVFKYSLDQVCKTYFQTDLKRVNVITSIENNIIVAIDNVLYLLTE